jgi:hypothetical protein
MFSLLDLREIRTVLEPSAGKGDILDRLKKEHDKAKYLSCSNKELDIDCVELDGNLQNLLKGKEYRVVHDDFLTYRTIKKYDLIIMNPPFAEGERHLLKALDMQSTGGKIVCILNAETIKNPYSVLRKDLVAKLGRLDAAVEYMENAFSDAFRTCTLLERTRSRRVSVGQDSRSILLGGDYVKGHRW